MSSISKAPLVGGGIGSMAPGALLTRDDGGDAERGCSMRGGRMLDTGWSRP